MNLSPGIRQLIAKGAAPVVILMALLSVLEGDRLKAYQDGKGIWTICKGLTTYQGRPVTQGMVLTKAQCAAEDARRGQEAINWVTTNVNPGVVSRMNNAQIAGVASFCYWNLGPGKCKGSTFYKKLNEGDFPAACAAIKTWIHDGGKDCRIRSNDCYGQVNRRDMESALTCWGLQ